MPGHPYRRRKGWFDNTVEVGTAKRIQSGAEIFGSLRNFRNDFGRHLVKKGKRKRIEANDDDGNFPDEYEEDLPGGGRKGIYSSTYLIGRLVSYY